jgi:hypothetical protein
MITQVFYSDAVSTSVAALVCGIVQAIAFAVLIVYLATPAPGLKDIPACVLVGLGPIHGLHGSLLISGVMA